ncbi:MAG: hypothetical protein WC292_02830 [Clostridia bacterium]
MLGRLTIRIDEISLFFNTICDVQISEGRASINFEERHNNGSDRTTIGISKSKIFVIRKNLFGDVSEEENVYIISDDSNRTRRVTVDINGYRALLFAGNMKIDISQDRVFAQIRCYMSVDDKKPEEYLLKLECFTID